MISLIFCGDLKYCPYIERYIERFEKKGIKYDVVFWNRSGESLNLPNNYKYYNSPSSLDKNKMSKLKDFIGFRRWVTNYLLHSDAEKCVLLSTLTGFLLSGVMFRKRIKYIFDIRDYSYEYIWPYYVVEKELIKRSFKTVISSKGFLNFLPKRFDYTIAHNFNRNETINSELHALSLEPITIVWMGLVRYFDYQSNLIKSLGNDNRFKMVYYGDGPELNRFKDFCENNSIRNVYFYGKYNNKEKNNLIKSATLINNCYGYKKRAGKKLKYAVSNRFYDGLIFRIPQIVEKGGYKSELVNKYDVGLEVNPEGNIGMSIINYLESLNYNQFTENCKKALQDIIEEDDCFIRIIDEFCDI